MSALFEERARMLSPRWRGPDGRWSRSGRLYCLETCEGAKLFQTKPDILVK